MTPPGDDVIDEARSLMRAGDLSRADGVLSDALERAPDRAELLYLRGVIANRRRDSAAAVTFLESAVAMNADLATAWLALGHARARLGAIDGAIHAYERAASLEPDAADARFNLGIVRQRAGDAQRAARAFYAAWARDPTLADAAKGFVGALARRVRECSADALAALPAPTVAAESDSRSISVVVCSIDDAKAARVHALYARLLRGTPHEIVVIRDAASLAEAYNRGIDATRSDVVVLSHDDIDILTPDFRAQLLAHLAAYDVVGVIGATRMAGPLPIWAGHPHLRGWITHLGADGEWNAGLLHPRRVAGDVVVLDGVLLAARRDVFRSVRFDAATFDGFHGYDIDWSYRAALAGLRLAAAGDLLVVHASRGRYDDVWQRYAERFCAKHRTGNIDPAPPPFYETSFASRAHVEAFFAEVMSIAQDDAGV